MEVGKVEVRWWKAERTVIISCSFQLSRSAEEGEKEKVGRRKVKIQGGHFFEF